MNAKETEPAAARAEPILDYDGNEVMVGEVTDNPGEGYYSIKHINKDKYSVRGLAVHEMYNRLCLKLTEMSKGVFAASGSMVLNNIMVLAMGGGLSTTPDSFDLFVDHTSVTLARLHDELAKTRLCETKISREENSSEPESLPRFRIVNAYTDRKFPSAFGELEVVSVNMFYVEELLEFDAEHENPDGAGPAVDDEGFDCHGCKWQRCPFPFKMFSCEVRPHHGTLETYRHHSPFRSRYRWGVVRCEGRCLPLHTRCVVEHEEHAADTENP